MHPAVVTVRAGDTQPVAAILLHVHGVTPKELGDLYAGRRRLCEQRRKRHPDRATWVLQCSGQLRRGDDGGVSAATLSASSWHDRQRITPRSVHGRQMKVLQSVHGYPSDARSSSPHARHLMTSRSFRTLDGVIGIVWMRPAWRRM